MGASINHKANDKRYRHDELRVYQFDSFLKIAGICNYPEDRSGEGFSITVYGNQSDKGDLNARLREFHVKDKNGDPKYRKSRGHHLPVYEVLKGVALPAYLMTLASEYTGGVIGPAALKYLNTKMVVFSIIMALLVAFLLLVMFYLMRQGGSVRQNHRPPAGSLSVY